MVYDLENRVPDLVIVSLDLLHLLMKCGVAFIGLSCLIGDPINLVGLSGPPMIGNPIIYNNREPC